MNCKRVQRSLSAYTDGLLSERERTDIALHLVRCGMCTARSGQLARLRGALRALPSLSPPSDLSTSLRVLASRERARTASPSRFRGGFLPHFALRARLWLDDMMRPVALPLAGGLLSAVVLFAMLVPTLAVPENSGIQDVPTGLTTEATVKELSPFGFPEDNVVLDLSVDEQGRVIDYSTPGGQGWMKDPVARRSIENMVLFTIFNPSTMFGQPSSGKVRVNFRRSEINVKG